MLSRFCSALSSTQAGEARKYSTVQSNVFVKLPTRQVSEVQWVHRAAGSSALCHVSLRVSPHAPATEEPDTEVGPVFLLPLEPSHLEPAAVHQPPPPPKKHSPAFTSSLPQSPKPRATHKSQRTHKELHPRFTGKRPSNALPPPPETALSGSRLSAVLCFGVADGRTHLFRPLPLVDRAA